MTSKARELANLLGGGTAGVAMFGGNAAIRVPNGTTEQRPEGANGMVRYNSTTGAVEVYDSLGWTAIAASPTITEVSPVSYNGAAGTSFTITGSNFEQSVTVKFITSSGAEYSAGSVTRSSASSLTATTPQNFTVSDEPLSVKVVNSSGLSYTIDGVIDCGGVPAWNTTAGSLSTVHETTRSGVSLSVSATDPDGGSVTYSVISGSLPPGLSLNSSTGAITGNASAVVSDTTSTFTIRASDPIGNSSDRQFSITVRALVTVNLTTVGSGSWVAPVGVSRVTVKMWGGGGSGASVGHLHGVGGGGGAGAFFNASVTGGSSYAFTVGGGGASSGGAGVNRNGLPGGSSSILGVTCGGGDAGRTSASGAGSPAGGAVSGSPPSSTFFVTESGQGTSTAMSGGTFGSAAGGTNWSGTISPFGGGAGRPQGNGSSVFGASGNYPGGGASSTYGSTDQSYPGADGRIEISY